MRITAIETHVCHARMRNWIFVKVVTDQPGLYGWGEATLEWHTRSVMGAIEDLASLLVGEDPTCVEHLWQMMWRQHFWHGSGVTRSTAIAGIDLALWDLIGKIHGVPCHKLWGGPVRDSIRLYCHLGGGNLESFYETPVDNAKQFADLARQSAGTGQHCSVAGIRVFSAELHHLRVGARRRSVAERRCGGRIHRRRRNANGDTKQKAGKMESQSTKTK